MPPPAPVGSLSEAQFRQVKAIGVALRPPATVTAPSRLKRADSYFGLHFDFHAGPDCKEIGKNTTPEMVEKIIEAAHPDYFHVI